MKVFFDFPNEERIWELNTVFTCFIIPKNAELICQITLMLHVVFMIASLYEPQLFFFVASMEFLRNLNYKSQLFGARFMNFTSFVCAKVARDFVRDI
jgi:hypothetical protein